MKTIPEFLPICGIGYNITIADGVVMFCEVITIYGHHNQINFTRRHCGEMWYVSIDETFEKAPVKHIIKMHELLESWFGEECP